MLSGDRRWAPARKGMTVLGKVPKPLNLPSQRLENHGLDPNVEIVPKGTLTWGNRPSPTTPNAWGLSNHSSPNADGSVDSSTRFNGRPSSSGSGTRPSTAGSDRSSEQVASAWKSNSRPSSASGLLASNQTQLAARPQSAETRPGSSQLSRFAESAIGHSGPWGSAGSTQKMGPASLGTRDFSLSSGDFPTLGSDKNSELYYEPESHTSGIHAPTPASTEKNRLEISESGNEKIDVHSDKGNANSWKTETPSIPSKAPASTDSRHGNLPNMQLATNINPAQSFSTPWQGHPPNVSDEVWCREIPSGGPYRPSSTAPAGNHQSDSCTYYPSQIPNRLDPSSHCAPRAGGHLTRYPNENGERFHPHPPDPFMVPKFPINPVRPGVYHGPVPYEGHYAPAGFGGPNVRERSVMGFAPGPPVYGQFPNQTFHQGPVHMTLRPGGPTQLIDDKIENTRQPEVASGQYKVLLKHQNHLAGSDSEGSRDQTTTSVSLSLEVNSNLEAVCGLARQGLKQKTVKDKLNSSISGGNLNSNDLQGCCQEVISANLCENIHERAGDSLIKKGDSSTISAETNILTTKSSKLIEKIETLNNKVRVTDGRLEGSFTKNDKAKRVDAGNSTHVNVKNSVPYASSFGGDSGTDLNILKSTPHDESTIPSRMNTLECRSANTPIPSESHASTFSMSSSYDVNTKAHAEYRRTRNMQGEGDHISKSRMDAEENNHWAKQLSRKDSLVTPNSNNIHDGLLTEELSSSQDHSNRVGPFQMEKPSVEAYSPSPLDSIDCKSQRAKMKEMATQRAKQLQKEEEERNREQKAKALAKLEELNRRCISSSSPEMRAENNACGSTSHGVVVKTSGDVPMRPDAHTSPLTNEPNGSYSDKVTSEHTNDLDMSNLEAHGSLLASQLPDIDSSQRNACDAGKNKGTEKQCFDSSKDCQHSARLVASENQIVAAKNGPADSLKKNNIQYHDSSNSKKRQMGHRRKQTIPEERNLEDKAVAPVDISGSEILMEAATETVTVEKFVSIQSNETCNSSSEQRRNERSNKNKSKSEEALECSHLTPAVQAKGILDKPTDIHQHNQKTLNGSVLPVPKTKKAGTSQNSREIPGSSNEGLLQAAGGSAKATNHWKSNPFKRSSRNGQSRPVDKFQGNENVVWAPVRPSKIEQTEESHESHAHAIGNSSTSSTGVNNSGNVKSRRAEIQRYVPKLVKDATQEGNCQPPVEMTVTHNVVLNIDKETDNVIFKEDKEDGSTMLDSVTLRKNTEATHANRHGKSLGASASWRQRTSLHESADATSSGMNLSDWKQLEDATSGIHAARSSDILIRPIDVSNELTRVSDVKEQGNTSKSRRQMQKVHKVVPVDGKDPTSEITGEAGVPPLALDWNATRMKSNAAESLNERAKSQWKPKSQTVPFHSNKQDMGSGGEKVASQTITQDKETPIITDQAPDKDITGKAAGMDERHNQPRKESKDFALENHNDRAGRDAESYQRQSAASPECEQVMQHMKRKDMRHRGQFSKGLDNSYGDTSRQNIPVSGDRQRQTSYYEYQRFEACNLSDKFQSVASNKGDGASGSTATGLKFREKAQGYKKGGAHFYVRSNVSYQEGKTSGRQS